MGPQLFSRTASSFLNATPIGQDRLVRKEVSLGMIREIPPPMEHIGLQFAPFLEVATDDVIFNYMRGDTDGLAPARAEDAESELAQKDESVLQEGRASVIDWSLKDHYDASDVNRYRELAKVVAAMQAGDPNNALDAPLSIRSMLSDFASKVARDAARRRRKLDNRIEWLIMNQSIATGGIAYNDGKIKFSVDYGRPVAQAASNPANNITGFVTNGVTDWSGTTHDPIGFINAVNEFMFDTYMVTCDRVITTRKTLRRIVNSDKFAQRAGLGAAVGTGGSQNPPDLHYLLDGWGPDAAVQVVENATGVSFMPYDSVYRTRPIGSNTITNNRFWPEGLMVFLPRESDLAQLDDTEVGFGKTLTSPHPEGQWTPGFYEWEQSTKDPWGQDMGTGIKAFPVFPHMDLTYAVQVTL